MQRPPPDDFLLKETNPHLVEQMEYLNVWVVKAKDLEYLHETYGFLDPLVEVKLGNYKGKTKHFEKKSIPNWNQVFAISKDQIQAPLLDVTVRDKDIIRDTFLGRVLFDLNDIPKRVPPDSPLVPQWFRLEDRKGDLIKGELMLAVWMGTQHDQASHFSH